jgi:hypothetical protein
VLSWANVEGTKLSAREVVKKNCKVKRSQQTGKSRRQGHVLQGNIPPLFRKHSANNFRHAILVKADGCDIIRKFKKAILDVRFG